MKYTLSVLMMTVFLCAALTGCNGKSGAGSSVNPEDALNKNASYALGMNVGSGLKADNLYPDMKEFARGINDILHDAKTRYTMDEAQQIFFEAYNALREKQELANQQQGLVNQQAENEFLAENSTKPGIKITDSGLQYEVITEGNGPKPDVWDTVRVHYEGTLTNGTEFDSSYSRGEPAEFPLSGVIPGWTEGLQLMSVGSKYRLFVPSDLGYGPQGRGQQIPPYSTLVFEIELLDIVDKNQ